MQMTRKATPRFVEMAWNVSVTALYTIVVYHQLSGSSSNIRIGEDRKSDTSLCQKAMKFFSSSLIYDRCISSIVRIFMDYLKWRRQDKRHLTFLKRREVYQYHLFTGLLHIINYRYSHRINEMEMTGKATPQFVERVWSVPVTALFTIVVYHQLSGSSSIFWNADDRKSDTTTCRNGVKCFSNSFTYDCCISSIVRIFIEY